MYQNNTQSDTCTCGHAKESHSTHGECGTMVATGGIPDVCDCTQYQARNTASDELSDDQLLALWHNLHSVCYHDDTQDSRILRAIKGVLQKHSDAASIASLQARINELERQQDSAIRTFHEIEQTLGHALHYPRYSDDPKSFPGATDDDVCVGEHVPETLATEAAQRIATLEAELARSKECVRTLSDLIRARVDDSVDRSASIRQLQSRIAELETQLQGVTRYFANESLANENTTLKQRVAELEADAARLDWLLNRAAYSVEYVGGPGWAILDQDIGSGITPREAIDAARAESEVQ